MVPPAYGMRRDVLALYRAVLHTARAFPDRSIAKKLQFNARELIRLRRDETDATAITQHVADGHTALRVYALLLERDHALLRAVTRKNNPPPSSQSPPA